MGNPVVLSVGGQFHLRRDKDRIIYAGMPSETVYSIVQRKMAGMALQGQGFAWNLFYPQNKRDIIIDGVNITVEDVTPDEIRLRVG